MKTLPDWWKRLPNSKPASVVSEEIFNTTMRSCYGFVELYKRGAVIENWTELRLAVDPVNGYEALVTNGLQPVTHPEEQYTGAFKNYYHTKLISPWFLKEKSGVDFMFLGAEWALEDIAWKILPGLMNFQHVGGTNVNVLLPKQRQDIFLDVGAPLIHLIPLRDDLRVKFKCHLISEEEFRRLFPIPANSSQMLYRMMKLHKRNEERKTAKCPFHGWAS